MCIRDRKGEAVDLNKLELDNENVYKLFSKGHTIGVFQFESSGMREYLKKLKPSGIEDLIAMNALYRPGPMQNIDDFISRKHGKNKIVYPHPIMEPILKETYGIIVYQEQVMQIAHEIAGFTLAEADIMRRAMGKKIKALMEELSVKFVNGAEGKGIKKKKAEEIFSLIEKFAQYGFNKSHSTAYAYVAYQTAWLKVHHPAEFMSANLTSEMGTIDRIVVLINECKKMGIEVIQELPGVGENLRDHYSPRLKYEISQSNATFSERGNGLRLMLEAMKYVFFRGGFIALTTVPMRMYFRTREGLETPDATISFMPFLTERINRTRAISKKPGITMSANVLRPESQGSIHIESKNAEKPPAIHFNFLSNEMDRNGLLFAIRKGRELMNSDPVSNIVKKEIAPGSELNTDEELLDWVRNNAETTYHPVGTCKMGNDPMAVVDNELKVHGIKQLRIADASIMPTLTSGNTNAPCSMIGEKCAAMVLKDAEP